MSFPTVYNMLGFCRGINIFYSAKYRSFHTPLGYKHLKSVLNNSMPFLKTQSVGVITTTNTSTTTSTTSYN